MPRTVVLVFQATSTFPLSVRASETVREPTPVFHSLFSLHAALGPYVRSMPLIILG